MNLPPEIWLMIFKHLRRMFRKEIIAKLEKKIKGPSRIQHFETMITIQSEIYLSPSHQYQIICSKTNWMPYELAWTKTFYYFGPKGYKRVYLVEMVRRSDF